MNETIIAAKVWDLLDNEERRAELSHWRGAGKFKDDKKWLGIGRRTKSSIDSLCRFGNFTLKNDFNILEWGSGGGANAYELSKYAKQYYGVDVSSKNLNEVTRILSSENIFNFTPILIENDPEDIFKIGSLNIDVFISTAVFQHFPSKEYGLRVLNILKKICSRGAIGLIQIRYADGSQKFAGNESVDQYSNSFIIATTYKIEDFWSMCNDVGFEVLFISNINPEVKYVTFNLRNRD